MPYSYWVNWKIENENHFQIALGKVLLCKGQAVSLFFQIFLLIIPGLKKLNHKIYSIYTAHRVNYRNYT